MTDKHSFILGDLISARRLFEIGLVHETDDQSDPGVWTVFERIPSRMQTNNDTWYYDQTTMLVLNDDFRTGWDVLVDGRIAWLSRIAADEIGFRLLRRM